MRIRRLVIMVLATAWPAFAAAPRLVVDEPVHDLGLVEPAQKLEHAFLLRNEGTAPARLTHVAATCGCTVAEYDREIAAGASGAVRAALDTTNFRPGPFQKTVHVETDDPALPSVTLTLRGDLQPHVVVTPNRLRWTVAADGSGHEAKTLVVWAPARTDFAITAAEATDSWLLAVAREAAAAERPAQSRGRVWRVEVKLAAEAPRGPLRGEIRLRTNHPDQPVALVPISGFIAAAAAPS